MPMRPNSNDKMEMIVPISISSCNKIRVFQQCMNMCVYIYKKKKNLEHKFDDLTRD